MARVLKVPDEKFRDKMAKSMEQWVSTIKKEIGFSPNPKTIKDAYTRAFENIMGVKLESGKPTKEEYRIFEEETKPRHTSKEWLYMESPKKNLGRAVKIAHDVKVIESDHKAGKLIRVRAEMQRDKILDVNITGDFFVIPKEAVSELEERLKGIILEKNVLLDIIEGYYSKYKTESPGVTPKDLVEALMKMKKYL